jgi:hypothetical protein
MSRKQFKVSGSTHEQKVSKKERQRLATEQRSQLPAEEVVVTEEETVQIKNLALYSVIGIGVILGLMYWIFISNQ